MALPSTPSIKQQLEEKLGAKAPEYWETLKQFLLGHLARAEFDAEARRLLPTPFLVQLHNALIVSLFDTSARVAPPTPPPDAPKPGAPPRKKRRYLPYAGPDGEMPSKHSERLKHWAIKVGRRERQRMRGLDSMTLSYERRPKLDMDEIRRERGVQLLPERGEPAGSRLPLHLAVATRALTLQNISDRVNLISAQHNLGPPAKAVSSLLMLSLESKLKQIITQAITLTSTSRAITSIHTSVPHAHTNVLTAASFQTLFTLSPAVLPNRSAAAMRLALADEYDRESDVEDPWMNAAREQLQAKGAMNEERWQRFAFIVQRSAVNEALRAAR